MTKSLYIDSTFSLLSFLHILKFVQRKTYKYVHFVCYFIFCTVIVTTNTDLSIIMNSKREMKGVLYLFKFQFFSTKLTHPNFGLDDIQPDCIMNSMTPFLFSISIL